jgi:hypothetical protein
MYLKIITLSSEQTYQASFQHQEIRGASQPPDKANLVSTTDDPPDRSGERSILKDAICNLATSPLESHFKFEPAIALTNGKNICRIVNNPLR